MKEAIVKFKKSNDLMQIEKEAVVMLEHARTAIKIQVRGDIKTAAAFMAKVNEKIKFVESEIKPAKVEADEYKKKILDLEKATAGVMKEAVRVTKEKMSIFYQAEERKRIETQRKLDKKTAQEEQKRCEELERQAENWAKKGNEKKAEERRDAAEQTFYATPLIPEAPQTIKSEDGSGATFRKDFDVAIISVDKLIKALLDMPIQLSEVITIRTGPLKAYIKATGNRNIPGVVVTDKHVVVSRG